MKVNLSKVSSEGGFTLLPIGEYKAFVFNSEQKRNVNGKDFVHLEMKVASGDYKGTALFDNLYLTEAAFWRLKQFAEAVNFPEVNEEDGFDTSDLFRFAQGKQLIVHVIQEPYRNKDNEEKMGNKIDGFRAISVCGAVQEVKEQLGADDIPF